MEVLITENKCIITPLSQKIDSIQQNRILDEVKRFTGIEVGLNLKYVSDCAVEFLEKLTQVEKLSLYNISSDIFTIINLMNMDKIFNIYVSQLDFIESKHRVINRKFLLV